MKPTSPVTLPSSSPATSDGKKKKENKEKREGEVCRGCEMEMSLGEEEYMCVYIYTHLCMNQDIVTGGEDEMKSSEKMTGDSPKMMIGGLPEKVFVSVMEEGTKSGNHLISAAAFVEGGTQDACDDACSICLESFSESDPHTVTGCKHEFHLQCILEWCQRSSQCPMCWQSISLKDPSSQELLDAIEQEKMIANNPSMNTTIFHHPTFGDFELQHVRFYFFFPSLMAMFGKLGDKLALPASATDAELEERIIQHLAAAAAMGRARHIARREGHRSQTSAHGRPRYLGFSAQPSVPSPTRPTSSDNVESTPAIGGSPLATVREESVSSSSAHATEHPASPLVSTIVPARPRESPSTDWSAMQSSPSNQDRAGPSELPSFSDFKTRVNAISMRYKESITKTTKNWKEKLFSRNSSAATNHGSTDPGEGSADVATLSRMMDHLEHDLGSPLSNTSSPSDHRRQQNNNVATTAANSASRNETPPPPPPPPPGSVVE
ncbi:hypothetical protein OSB04_029412 [Centaurea solstitialis]|uniref:RING-type E3 ubiquitin transferase n=1 Tax=Centaurea solstitialis TaxID=347529 RepID=A0AA38SUG1_9ASTR|nr:hypothetical protein OSB04_029412 [Centaurea solstitialis]